MHGPYSCLCAYNPVAYLHVHACVQHLGLVPIVWQGLLQKKTSPSLFLTSVVPGYVPKNQQLETRAAFVCLVRNHHWPTLCCVRVPKNDGCCCISCMNICEDVLGLPICWSRCLDIYTYLDALQLCFDEFQGHALQLSTAIAKEKDHCWCVWERPGTCEICHKRIMVPEDAAHQKSWEHLATDV